MFSIEGTGGGRVGEAAIMQFEALRPVYGVGEYRRNPMYSGMLWGQAETCGDQKYRRHRRHSWAK